MKEEKGEDDKIQLVQVPVIQVIIIKYIIVARNVELELPGTPEYVELFQMCGYVEAAQEEFSENCRKFKLPENQ